MLEVGKNKIRCLTSNFCFGLEEPKHESKNAENDNGNRERNNSGDEVVFERIKFVAGGCRGGVVLEVARNHVVKIHRDTLSGLVGFPSLVIIVYTMKLKLSIGK